MGGGRELLTFGRRVAKSVAAGALHYSGLRQLLSSAQRAQVGGSRVLILSYHRVVQDFAEASRAAIPGLLVSQRTFAGQIDELHRSGYDLVPLSEALDVVSGKQRRKRDVAVLTFDDGYRDNYECAFPVLRQKGVPATIYLASGFVGTTHRFAHDRLYHLLRQCLARGARRLGRNVVMPEGLDGGTVEAVDRLILTRSSAELLALIGRLEASLGARNEVQPTSGLAMTWDMAREMARAGIDFGAHTVNHVNLTHESAESVEAELASSKASIEAELGRPVVDFAYPNGYYDRRVVSSLVKHGYRSGVTTEDLPNRVGGDLFRLKRKMLWENYSLGPFGYSATLTGCHFDDVFAMLALTRPLLGEVPRGADSEEPLVVEAPVRNHPAEAQGDGASA